MIVMVVLRLLDIFWTYMPKLFPSQIYCSFFSVNIVISIKKLRYENERYFFPWGQTKEKDKMINVQERNLKTENE